MWGKTWWTAGRSIHVSRRCQPQNREAQPGKGAANLQVRFANTPKTCPTSTQHSNQQPGLPSNRFFCQFTGEHWVGKRLTPPDWNALCINKLCIAGAGRGRLEGHPFRVVVSLTLAGRVPSSTTSTGENRNGNRKGMVLFQAIYAMSARNAQDARPALAINHQAHVL